ncbi:MAG: hypothetical protein C5B59_04685 [Bacteroidetes bacterium]|nr:MAG: hypothetical protein C5B59_04685 [Bacteroidota bacterium]
MKNLKFGEPRLSRSIEFCRNLSDSIIFSISVLIIGGIATVLSSAKWHMGLFAWIGPLFFLCYFRMTRIKRKTLWFFLVYLCRSIIAFKDVVPFPLPGIIVVGLIQTIQSWLIYLSDRWITRKSDRFLSTLYFPAASVSVEFIPAALGGSIWFSVANSQVAFNWITQLASITGLWGISFIIYWFGSVLVWAIQRNSEPRRAKRGIVIYSSVFLTVILFGFIRSNSNAMKSSAQVRVAGLSVPLTGFLENLYKDYCGREISIDPTWSITSSKVREIQKAELPFIETPDSAKFKYAYAAMKLANDSLFALSKKAADNGARFILWSEANALVFKNDEEQLIERGLKFSKKNKVYLVMTIAAIHPGKITATTKFLENETVFISPLGEIMNIFHKNNPVPMAEATEPGDGVIPVIITPYGRIAVSICYDADFPIQMRQLGNKKADFLFLPSGDWYSISPFHSYMAVFRGIENGTAVVRQASSGLSILSDSRGRIVKSFDYYLPGEKLWFADIQSKHENTVYSRIGDSFAWICVFIMLMGLTYRLANNSRKDES